MLTREEKREAVLWACMNTLRVATQSVAEGRQSVYKAFHWAWLVLDGMAYGYHNIWEHELADLADYYAEVANNKATKALYK